MSSSGTAASLYAATISPASVNGAEPEEAKDKRHHLKDGKGFTNPWDSWREFSGPGIMKAMVMYALSSVVTPKAQPSPGAGSKALQIAPIPHPQQ